MDAFEAALIASIRAGCLYLLQSHDSETEEYRPTRKKIIKTILSLVELVGEIPPILKMLLPCAALTVFVEKKGQHPWLEERQPSILECVHQMSKCCPESMSHLKEECNKLTKYVAELKEEDRTTLQREILDIRDKLVAVLEDQDEEGEDEDCMIVEEEAKKGEEEEEDEKAEEEREEEENEEKEKDEESEEQMEEEIESDNDQVEDVSDSVDQQLSKGVKRSLIDHESDDDNTSDAAASSGNTTPFGRRPRKNAWPAWAVKNLLTGVNNYGAGKWSKIFAAFSFHDNCNPVKLKDKWRNLIKYNHIECRDGKYILK